jgi:biopolymer transport protein ExbD
MRHGYHSWTKTAVKWPNRIHSRVDAYPLVGLAFTLLVAFMVSTPLVTHGFVVDLPRTSYPSPMPRAVREDAQIVSVTSDGQVYYRDVRIMADELPDQIRESVRNGADRKIYIRADARVKYGRVKEVLDETGKAGIRNVCFLADKVLP